MEFAHTTTRDVGKISRIHNRLTAKSGEHQTHQIRAGGFDRFAGGKLGGSGNPAMTLGMTDAQLTDVGNALATPVASEITAYDQTGMSRSGKNFIGATVR